MTRMPIRLGDIERGTVAISRPPRSVVWQRDERRRGVVARTSIVPPATPDSASESGTAIVRPLTGTRSITGGVAVEVDDALDPREVARRVLGDRRDRVAAVGDAAEVVGLRDARRARRRRAGSRTSRAGDALDAVDEHPQRADARRCRSPRRRPGRCSARKPRLRQAGVDAPAATGSSTVTRAEWRLIPAWLPVAAVAGEAQR